LQGGPRKEVFLCNVAPGRGQRRSGGNSGRGSPDSGRGRVGEWPRDYGDSVWALGWWRKGGRQGAPRHSRAVRTWSSPPASPRPEQQGGGAAWLQRSRKARVRGAGDCGRDRGKVWQRRRQMPTASSGGQGGAGRVAARGRLPFLRRPAYPLGTSGRLRTLLGTRAPDDEEGTAGLYCARTAARFSGRSRCSRRREASRDLGTTRATLGTCAGGPRRRGGAGPRRAGRRDVAARPRSGAARFGLHHFEHVFLSKFEYKCTK
jgi:hypothetical protein